MNTWGREDDLSLLEILNVLLKRSLGIVGFPVGATAVVVGLSFFFPTTYTASTSFVPESRASSRLPAGLAGLAGQFGISPELFGTDASQSPKFYADVAKSREILDRLLVTRYANPWPTRQSGDSVTLLALLRTKGRSVADSLERGAKELAKRLSVEVSSQTNIVTVEVTLPSPDLAAAVANRLVQYLNEFNTQTRQSQASERRKFVEQRIAVGEQDLQSAEDALKGFYQANRSWQQAPALVFEEGRLRRQVDVRQELYLALRREYETARIEEVNDTPVITIIDPAVVPQRKSGPKRVMWALLTFFLTGGVALFWVFAAESVDRARRVDDGHYRELEATVRGVRETLRRITGLSSPRDAS